MNKSISIICQFDNFNPNKVMLDIIMNFNTSTMMVMLYLIILIIMVTFNLSFHQEAAICLWYHIRQHCKSYRCYQIWFACRARSWKRKAWSWRKCSGTLWLGTRKVWLGSCLYPSCPWNRLRRRWWILGVVCTWWKCRVTLFSTHLKQWLL